MSWKDKQGVIFH